MISLAEKKSNNQLDFYFDFISPYGWIGAEKINEIAAEYDLTVNWHPFLLKASVIDTMKITPPLDTPLKGDYLLHDINRCLRYYGMTIHDQARFGFSSIAPARVILWVRDHFPQLIERIVLNLYRAHWVEGNDISKVENILQAVGVLSLSLEKLHEIVNDDVYKQKLRNETQEAMSYGIFGSPSVRLGREVFWGADRLTMVEDWLKRGGW